MKHNRSHRALGLAVIFALVSVLCVLPAGPAAAAEPIVVNGHLEQAYAQSFADLSYTRDSGQKFTGLLSVVESADWYYFGFQQNMQAKSNAYCEDEKNSPGCFQDFGALRGSDYISFEWGDLYIPVDIISETGGGKKGAPVVTTPSGYVGRIGTGDGGSLEGASASDVQGVSAMDYNMNVLGWVDLENSPNFAGQPNAPYIYPSVAEIAVKKSAFPAGANPRQPTVVVHNSPGGRTTAFNAIAINCPANTGGDAGSTVSLDVQVTENGIGKSGQPVLVLLTGPGSVVSVGGTAGNKGTSGTGGITTVVVTSPTAGTTQVRAVLDLNNNGQWDQATEPSTEPTCPVVWEEPPPGVIQIVKSGPATAKRGDTITYTMDVSIPTGDVPIHDVVVTDPDCNAGTLLRLSGAASGDANSDNILQHTETWHYTCQRTIALNAVSPLPNISRVDGLDTLDRPVSDTDDHLVELTRIPPEIHIEKGGPDEAQVGEVIEYEMAVSIPIDVPLTNVQVTDPRCDEAPRRVSQEGGDFDEVLEFGEVWHYVCPHEVLASDPNPLPNTATATGIGPEGDQVQDDDSHVVQIVPLPKVKIVKDGPQKADVGDTITYTLVVSIPVDRPLHDVVVTDSKCDTQPKLQDKVGGDNDNILELGEVWIYTCKHKVTASDVPEIHNVAHVEGRDERGKKATDKDDHDVKVDQVQRKVIINPPAPSGRLPFTGSNPMGFVVTAIMLLISGAAAMIVARKDSKVRSKS